MHTFITFTGIFVAINFKSSDFALFQHWRDMPNYAILVDIRDRPSSQITYVPEENIEVITNTKVCTWSLKFVPSGKHSRNLKLKVSHQRFHFQQNPNCSQLDLMSGLFFNANNVQPVCRWD